MSEDLVYRHSTPRAIKAAASAALTRADRSLERARAARDHFLDQVFEQQPLDVQERWDDFDCNVRNSEVEKRSSKRARALITATKEDDPTNKRLCALETEVLLLKEELKTVKEQIDEDSDSSSSSSDSSSIDE